MTPQDFAKAVDKLAFKKDDSLALGLLMKSILQRKDLETTVEGAKFQGSIYEEFGIKPP